MTDIKPARTPRWSLLVLAGLLIFDVWLRGHTFGPTLRDRFGLDLWPVSGAEAEPLDCDEAAYAYIGRRIDQGAVMYRDLTENKPPGGYWLYALALAIGGSDELTVRVMPIPIILATITLVWWLGLRLRGPGAACLAAFLYAVASTDPYLYGNGANFEHAINLFAIASVAALIAAIDRGSRRLLFASGVCLGIACLFKQVVILHGPVLAIGLLCQARPFRDRLKDVITLAAGFVLIWGSAALILVLQGAGTSAYEDIFQYGRALATDTPAEPNAPPFWMRWVTGNADPSGHLPPRLERPTTSSGGGREPGRSGSRASPRSSRWGSRVPRQWPGGWSRPGRSQPGSRSHSPASSGSTITCFPCPAWRSWWRFTSPIRCRE
ncbi:Dolichyl-phosphate-mannose-protein mannosyltransferase [Singulisphaera sp. GP187]|uniref:ArnT family glycosyltransferase n=1 Tax=Singulisphaera sp. GP187 TaxID=1882752 RepID=UPI00092A6912|nr:glycosyltransferase family 39 protein [Singulisphaera sp. GP187]SIO67383.1 Dolichyl-phosphate-mannose-protein mannosyltransferase [Singulisphaera sp. GP187]